MVLFPHEVIPMSATTQATAVVEEGAVESPLQPEERERILHALEVLLEGDEEEQRETFAFLRKALDEDRPCYRRIFSSK